MGNVIRRRRVPRREFHRRIGLLIHGEYQVNRAVQIGEGGMMIVSAVPLTMDQSVVITFRLPEVAPDCVRGVVRYILEAKGDVPVRYGIEFANLDFNVKREIRNYVASKSANEMNNPTFN